MVNIEPKVLLDIGSDFYKNVGNIPKLTPGLNVFIQKVGKAACICLFETLLSYSFVFVVFLFFVFGERYVKYLCKYNGLAFFEF